MTQSEYGSGLTSPLYTILLETKDWVSVGELFGRVVSEIPTHKAMRKAVQLSHNVKTADDFSLDEANWLYFKDQIRNLPVEFDRLGPRRSIVADGKVRLLSEGTCTCGGAAYRARPYGNTVLRCSKCDQEFVRREDNQQPPTTEATLHPDLPTDIMACITHIRRLEATTPFRLIRLKTGMWGFRAPTYGAGE